MLVYYFFWPLFLRFAHATCFPYAFRPLQEYTIRLRVAKPDEPFEPCPLAALLLAAAVTASRLPVQYDVTHGLRGLV